MLVLLVVAHQNVAFDSMTFVPTLMKNGAAETQAYKEKNKYMKS
jgi:hypothetical protein